MMVKIEHIADGVYKIDETLSTSSLTVTAQELRDIYNWALLNRRELEQWASPSPFDTDKEPALRPDQPGREGRAKILKWIPVGNIEKGQLKQVSDEAIVKALVKHPDFFLAIGPVKVRNTNTGYVLEDGLNRWEAAKRLGDDWAIECEVLCKSVENSVI